jgi:hypothetical protein
MEQSTEMVGGFLVEAPLHEDSKRYPVNIEVRKMSFKAEGSLNAYYDFRVPDIGNVPLGNYCVQITVDGEKHGKDVWVSNDLASSTEIRWNGHY